MNKLLLLVVFLIAGTSLSKAQETVDVLMKKALSEAAASEKHVLVKFEASWCGWCHRMNEQLKDPSVASYFKENYVMLPIVVFENGNNVSLENPGSRELLKKYKGATAGLPFWVILDGSGNVITNSFNEKGVNLGCPASQKEVVVFIEKLKATSEMSKEDEKNVAIVFTKK
ncbi:thioredoxin family protein [Nonlabens sp.]|uniref:thioredoxin family protein n=1 Tax=Nonlabens sp. TaxID=1888209 RepID=UPI001BCDCFA5|nr:thioredoxin family protein [Nonlabens sp.]